MAIKTIVITLTHQYSVITELNRVCYTGILSWNFLPLYFPNVCSCVCKSVCLLVFLIQSLASSKLLVLDLMQHHD